MNNIISDIAMNAFLDDKNFHCSSISAVRLEDPSMSDREVLVKLLKKAAELSSKGYVIDFYFDEDMF